MEPTGSYESSGSPELGGPISLFNRTLDFATCGAERPSIPHVRFRSGTENALSLLRVCSTAERGLRGGRLRADALREASALLPYEYISDHAVTAAHSSGATSSLSARRRFSRAPGHPCGGTEKDMPANIRDGHPRENRRSPTTPSCEHKSPQRPMGAPQEPSGTICGEGRLAPRLCVGLRRVIRAGSRSKWSQCTYAPLASVLSPSPLSFSAIAAINYQLSTPPPFFLLASLAPLGSPWSLASLGSLVLALVSP
jgi:hypothetical protein